jgi:hypothetical protein
MTNRSSALLYIPIIVVVGFLGYLLGKENQSSGHPQNPASPMIAGGIRSENGGSLQPPRTVRKTEKESPPKPSEAFWDNENNSKIKYSLLDKNGNITTAAAEAARLSPEERNAAQQIIGAIKSDVEKDTAARAMLDKAKSSITEGKTVYQIPASSDRGEDALANIQNQLTNALGADKAAILCKSYDPSLTMGGFGKYDVQLEFYSPESKIGAGSNLVQFDYTDPVSGAVVTHAEMDLSHFKSVYGNSFVFDSEK